MHTPTLFLLLGCLLTFLASLLAYYGLNRGMAPKAKGQQTRRFLIASLLAWLPAALAQAEPSAPLVAAWLTGMAWAVAYPALYHLTFRHTSPDYENYADTACGLYLFGWLSAVSLLGGWWLAAVAEWAALMVCLTQAVYYRLYSTCIDANGMKIVQDSHPNEIIEFAKSYPLWQTAAVVAAAVGLLGAVWLLGASGAAVGGPVYTVAALAVYAVAIGWYVAKPRRGMLARSGVVALWLTVREYSAGDRRYVSEMQRRLADLYVRALGQPYDRPSTVLLVIGESASRDYMSAFTEMERDTTPWMRAMAADRRHTVLFGHAYSCAMHTVQSLEKALTEYNQYNDRRFYESCSVIDIAHKLGYRVHWYSNQGHLGAADTPITLVANTAETAKWTRQELGKVQYDEALLDFLDELDATRNNLLVLHLKGSHFNFQNRYPADRAVWEVQNEVDSFENSLRYTDDTLRRAYDYCRERLNLQCMVYFSDHATIPDRKRSPNFSGFGDTRIPLFCWMSDEYQAKHAARAEALRQNSECYFTNDLVYELMCGLLDVESNHYDESASLASASYRFSREDLFTYEGKRCIAEDR